ncbi:MAG: hypothetical protein A2X05_13295 [Bacteroidetes bacterium GWE2_41_25]|nr:MAG: hypothetical protein A2X03_14045 [Bacteroidetes bacterium GWA2_40_15]OFX98256.1 MAG: hypothetical protein A2X06_05335 [Bacteroidetes bacterium GWC2_40_22]OFY11252.1 MAG: hypothetical protein A2X05_13295 [Bacteroidetes bacterium GWE2_41_25]HBH82272.1 hypothetical protein [Bacteroidales bacterium]HBQ84566.1 hypothetical protein [Bacteroidales bacterium]
MERRNFIKTAGYSAAATVISPKIGEGAIPDKNKGVAQQAAEYKSTVKVTDNKIVIDTISLTAAIEKGIITSLKDKASGEEFIEKPDTTNFRALQLLYRNNELININEEKFGSTVTQQVSEQRAEIRFNSWDGDGVLTVSVEDITGDLIIEPSAYSSRPGVLACRWNISGIKPSLDLVAPFFQGARLKMDDPLIKNSRWRWPSDWEAGLAIFQSKERGFWIHTQDTQYRFKALQTGTASEAFVIGLDSEAYGPIDDNLSAGGICWRINTYKGDWGVPAEKYRHWYWKAYNLEAEEQLRQKWISDVKFAISWCPGNTDVLDALAKKIDPAKVLIHFSNWRTDGYDENYPDYFASDVAKVFLKKGREMGFHIMPHFNSIDMDPSNPVYDRVRDFPYRSVETKQLQGWSWYNSRVIGVPESNTNRLGNRDKKVMVKIHPGLSMWRSILGERILTASKELQLNTVFIDVTLCIWNIHNSIVESMSPAEGMNRLIRHVSELGNGLVVVGEGLNEITAQRLSFAQVHLYRSWQTSTEGLERAGGCNLNEVLFGKLCRTFGYTGLSGKNKDEELRMQIHLDHGAIPTVTIRSADEIINPNPAVKRMMELGNG